jgi:hypothetical protein
MIRLPARSPNLNSFAERNSMPRFIDSKGLKIEFLESRGDRFAVVVCARPLPLH